MPAQLPLPALFHIRPVYMVTEDEDDRLSNIYWLSTPMGDESDHEQDLVCFIVDYLGFYIFKVVKSKGPWLRYVLGHDASYSKQSIQSDVYQSVEGS